MKSGTSTLPTKEERERIDKELEKVKKVYHSRRSIVTPFPVRKLTIV